MTLVCLKPLLFVLLTKNVYTNSLFNNANKAKKSVEKACAKCVPKAHAGHHTHSAWNSCLQPSKMQGANHVEILQSLHCLKTLREHSTNEGLQLLPRSMERI